MPNSTDRADHDEPGVGPVPWDGIGPPIEPSVGSPGDLGAHSAHLTDRVDGIPPVWGNVPPRNPNFTGRVELLDQLSQRLTAGGTTVILPAALHGTGGIGKTQMAVEYIYRRLREYDIVWWIQATQPAQIRAGLTELAQYLRLPGSAEANTAVPAVREALQLGQPFRRWLLVFDSAESPEVVSQFFPTDGPGEVLITSRNPDWSDIARSLEVTVFSREESVELLRRWGPEISDADADRLCARLNDLPLAIELAAAWRAETGRSAFEYLRLFDEKVAEILDTSDRSDHELSVAAAWNVSFDALQKHNPAAHQLLQVCAFFSPEPITRSLFTGVRGVSISTDLDAALRDPMQLGRAIRDLNRYCLAKIDYRKDALHIHRLVQLELRKRMSVRQRADMRHGAHVLLANFDPNDPSSAREWPRYQLLLPHVYASELVQCRDPWVRQLVLNLSYYLYHWGDFDGAVVLAEQAFSTWSDMHGDADQHTLEAASHLGMHLWALGRYAEAAEINRRTLDLRRHLSGENAEETITVELRVAVDMKARGEFPAALELNERIHRKAVRWYDKDDPITLQTAHDLAVTFRLCGDYRRAYELDEYTYQRRAEVLGYDNMNTLNTLSGLLLDLRELGEYRRARAGHEQIATTVREILGENKADTLRKTWHLAVARRKDGDHTAALEQSTQTLALYRRWYGDDHRDTMACAIANSIDLRYAGELEPARLLGVGTLDRYRGKLGEHHPDTLSAEVDLAVTVRLLGDADAARQLTERSLDQFRRALGPDHPHAIVCAINLASDLAALGDVDAAAALGVEVLERSERVLGTDHPITLAVRLNLALDQRALGRTREAGRRCREALARFRHRLGDGHPLAVAAAHEVRIDCDIDPLPG
jgi:hypothetical protein